MLIHSLGILYWPKWEEESRYSETLIYRQYREDTPSQATVIEVFEKELKRLKHEDRTPFFQSRGINYVYITGDNDIVLMATCLKNANAMLLVVFLKNFYQVIRQYLVKAKVKRESKGGFKTENSVTKNVIIDNTILLYELADECIDYGLIQNTDYNIMKEYIKVETTFPEIYSSDDESNDTNYMGKVSRRSRKNSIAEKLKPKPDVRSTFNKAVKPDILAAEETHINSAVLKTTHLAVNWRPKGIFYPKNEIYIDLVESCDFLYDLNSGTVRNNEIHGQCIVKCYLSGMPKCTLGFNEKTLSRISSDENWEGITPEDSSVKDKGENLIQNSSNDPTQFGSIEEEEETFSQDNSSQQSVDRKQRKYRIPITNIQFHQCVLLASIYYEKMLQFIPPDEEFQLMAYRVEQLKKNRAPLVMIEPTYEVYRSSNKIRLLCVLSTNFRKLLHCNRLILKFPVNPHLFCINYDSNTSGGGFKYKTQLGDVNFKIDTSQVVWVIPLTTGNVKEVKMMAEVTLKPPRSGLGAIDEAVIADSLSNKVDTRTNFHEQEENAIDDLDRYYGVSGSNSSRTTEASRAFPNKSFAFIEVSFSISMMSYSGLKVTYLNVEEDLLNYNCFPWVRYVTKASESTNDTPHIETNRYRTSLYRFQLAPRCFLFID